MTNEWIAVLSACVGALLTGILHYMKTKIQSGTDDKVSFRQNILSRIEHLEKNQAELEKTVMIWKGRYWSLYTWLVNFCIIHGVDATPPSFHEMDLDALKEEFQRRASEKRKKDNDNET